MTELSEAIVSEGQPHESTTETDSESLLPLCDLAGYACFVSWAFAIGWFEGLTPLPGSGEAGFFLLRLPLFLGVALSSCLFFLTGGKTPDPTRSKFLEACSFICCLVCPLTFFVTLPVEAVMVLWFIAGVGQSSCFFIWALRLKVLSRKQQLHAVCGAFIIAGFALSLLPFMEQGMTRGTLALLPLGSYVCLVFARRHFSGSTEKRRTKGLTKKGGFQSFRAQIPFEDDRRFILMKGVHAILYATFLGFSTCAALAPWLYPANEIVLGLANAAAAIAMVAALHVNEKRTCNDLPRLLIPVTGTGMLLLGVLWPHPTLLVFCAVLFMLCACYEILNAHTTYAYSSYDSIRCLWELYSSKAGTGLGFLLGWGTATGILFVLRYDRTALLIVGFLLFVLIATVNDLLFKKSKLVFGTVMVDEETQLGVLDAKLGELALPNKGKWRTACNDLSERYRLSPRQKEIFFLLAKGRNVQYIKEELVLSTPTVKSHVYSIYQKMDIHSHQELINIIEQTVRAKGGEFSTNHP